MVTKSLKDVDARMVELSTLTNKQLAELLGKKNLNHRFMAREWAKQDILQKEFSGELFNAYMRGGR